MKSCKAILRLPFFFKSLRRQSFWMQVATSMMGKHHKNSNTKLTVSMRQDIAFSLDTDSRGSWMDERILFHQRNGHFFDGKMHPNFKMSEYEKTYA